MDRQTKHTLPEFFYFADYSMCMCIQGVYNAPMVWMRGDALTRTRYVLYASTYFFVAILQRSLALLPCLAHAITCPRISRPPSAQLTPSSLPALQAFLFFILLSAYAVMKKEPNH